MLPIQTLKLIPAFTGAPVLLSARGGGGSGLSHGILVQANRSPDIVGNTLLRGSGGERQLDTDPFKSLCDGTPVFFVT